MVVVQDAFFPFPTDPPVGYVGPAPGPHEGTCLTGMPGDDEDDEDYLSDENDGSICDVLGCDRLCAPNDNKCWVGCVTLVTWAYRSYGALCSGSMN